jgi:predicted amidohydrolase YtcJ
MTETFRLPLLADHHTHPLLYAAFSKTVSLMAVRSKTAANNLIVDALNKADSEMIVAHGWRNNHFDWSPQELELLPPVAIFNLSLHSLKMNSAGMRVMKNLYGEDVDRVVNQDWYEENFRTVLNWFANLYASEEALVDFYEQLLQLGIFHAEEMLLFDEREIALFKNTGLIDRTRFWAAPDTFAALSQSAKAQVHGLKLFTDGAIGARTAALTRPFISKSNVDDDAPSHGNLLYSLDALQQTIENCLGTGKALAVHAIGDRAIEQSVAALENCRQLVDDAPEVRIEHAQLIDRPTAARTKNLGLVLSMQPNFSTDSVDYRDRLDDQYCRANNPFRMLIDEISFEPGRDLIFGSDGMPHGIEFALQQSLFPSLESQRLTIEEFKAGYCLDHDEPGYIEVEMDGHKLIRCKFHVRKV